MARFYGLLTACGVIAMLFLIGTVVLGLISLVRPEWIFYNVDNANPSVYTFETASRWRGMFDICLKDNLSLPVNSSNERIRERRCYEIELNSDPNYAPDDWRIIDLRRAHIALHIIGVFFGFVTLLYLFVAIIVIWGGPTSSRFRCHFFVAGSLVALGVTMYCCAFLVFHNLMHKEKLAASWGTKLDSVLGTISSGAKNRTTANFSSMYACAWTSLLAELLAVFFLFVPAMCCAYENDEGTEKFISGSQSQSYPRATTAQSHQMQNLNLQPSQSQRQPQLAAAVSGGSPQIYSNTEISRANPILLESSTYPGRASGGVVASGGMQMNSSSTSLVPVYYQTPGHSPAGTLELAKNTPDAYIAVSKH